MKIFDLLKWLSQPVVRLVSALFAPVALVLGTIADPGGALNSFLIRTVDLLAVYWPSTPEELKISNLIFSASGAGIGRTVLIDSLQTIVLIAGVVGLVKLYKLIPFKMT
jgi:hypothetical protein